MLEIQGFSKHYDDVVAVDDLGFTIEQGEFATILGPSGCGKSTTLHAIAGLVEPTAGTIHLRGTDITTASPSERNIGMAFQHTALFPHMTTAENLAYGLRMHGWDEEAVDARIEELLELIQLPDYGDHYPDELSGGQQQRVSLARAIAYEPDMLLLDEPLTGLDRVLREEMREEIKRIQDQVDVTTLYVTHDQEEALSLSDKIIVMNDGEKQQVGTPKEIYQNPANEFVAEFVGKSTQFQGTVTSADPVILEGAGMEVRTGLTADAVILEGGGTEVQTGSTASVDQGDTATAYVRPSDITIEPAGTTGENAFPGRVTTVTNLGTRAEVQVDVHGVEFLVETERFPNLAEGDEVTVRFDAEDVIVL